MKEFYEAPKANVVKFDAACVICTSGRDEESSEP